MAAVQNSGVGTTIPILNLRFRSSMWQWIFEKYASFVAAISCKM